MPAASIGVPTMGGVQTSLMNYAVGVGAGLLYDVIRGFTGSGLIGGALSASITGAAVRGVAGEMVAVSSGFAVGQSGLAGLGLAGLMPQSTPPANGPQTELI
tara:strand:- start:177 stop:482 length:306 start_codon:yes stop_codon:yes gene_type:complete